MNDDTHSFFSQAFDAYALMTEDEGPINIPAHFLADFAEYCATVDQPFAEVVKKAQVILAVRRLST